MAPSEITPFVLTYNEAPNLVRCLDSLDWASQILVLDSCSTDATVEIVARYPKARFVTRPFDTHSNQANFALGLIETSWVLSLDADYIVTPELQRAITGGEIEFDPTCVYFAPFTFCVHGHPLHTHFMPPRGVLYARHGAIYEQDGHTQRLVMADHRQVNLTVRIIHDDRKPLKRWLESQRKYAALEAEKLRVADPRSLPLQDMIRRTGWASPIVMFFYALLLRGLIFEGWPGLIYAMERVYAEFLLELHIMDLRLREGASKLIE